MATMPEGPWPAELALDLARHHIEAEDFNGLYLAGMPTNTAVIPCFETPEATAAMLGLQIMAGNMDHPDWLIFVADTYHIELAEGERHPGSLGAAFEAGDPRVTEAAVVLCVCPDGPSYQAIQTYVRDGEKVEWGEIVTATHVGDVGPMYDLMTAVLMAPPGSVPEAADGIGQLRVPLP